MMDDIRGTVKRPSGKRLATEYDEYGFESGIHILHR